MLRHAETRLPLQGTFLVIAEEAVRSLYSGQRMKTSTHDRTITCYPTPERQAHSTLHCHLGRYTGQLIVVESVISLQAAHDGAGEGLHDVS